jgi:hypothetical protein
MYVLAPGRSTCGISDGVQVMSDIVFPEGKIEPDLDAKIVRPQLAPLGR